MATTTVRLNSVRIVPLTNPECLADFECGETDIDRRVAGCCEKHNSYQARTTCAVIEGEQLACGMYMLGVVVHSSMRIPKFFKKEHVAFLYLHCFAVRQHLQRQGIGSLLLGHCLRRCAQMVTEIGGVHGVALNAQSTTVADIYDRYGFREFGGRARYPFMVLPAQSLLDLQKIRV